MNNQYFLHFQSYRHRHLLVLFAFLLPVFGIQLTAQVTNEFFQNSYPAPPNGPTTTDQNALTFVNATTMSSPPVTVTASWSMQQFNSVEGNPTVPGSTFGTSGQSSGNGNTNDNLATPASVFVPMNDISGPAANNFTDCATCPPGTGVSVTNNYAFNLFSTADALIDDDGNNLFPLNSRVPYSDLTLNFSRPVNNPVLHIVGLGGTYEYTTNLGGATQRSYTIGFASEFDLVTPNLSLTRLSGNAAFGVTPTSIVNNRQNVGAPTTPTVIRGVERGSATGSVVVNGMGITSVTFRVFLRGDGGDIRDINDNPATPLNGNDVIWSASLNYMPNGGGTSMFNAFNGDRYLIGVAFQSCPQLITETDDQRFCENQTGDDIAVTTDINDANGIRFVRFATDQVADTIPTMAEANNIYNNGTTIATVTPTGAAEPYTATYAYNAADFPGPGTYYVYAILNPDRGGDCQPAREIEVIIDPLATVEAGGPDVVCQSDTPQPITLTGATVGGGAATAAWSIVSGGGTLSSTAQTATPATVTYTPAMGFTGTVTLLLTTDNADNTCPAVTDTRTITVEEAATVEAAGPDMVCQSDTPQPITLTGATVGGGGRTAAWSIVSGGGMLSGTAQTETPEAVTYTPAMGFTGTVTLQLTTDDPAGPCPAVTDTRTITVEEAATVEAGGPDVVCQSDTPDAITLAGATFGGGGTTAAWSIVSGGGMLSSTAQTATPATETYTPAAGFAGTVTLELTTNDPDGACPAVTDTRTITVEEAATVEAGEPQTVCQTTNPFVVTLTGATVGGSATEASWSIVSGGGTLSSTVLTDDPASVTYTPEENFSGTVTLQLTSEVPTGSCPAVTDLRILEVLNVDCGTFPWSGEE